MKTNDSNEPDEGFEDIVTSEGKHFYDNQGENDTITKVTGMYKDWFLITLHIILERAVRD
jgi:topoisomerase-4 subunit A